jgi:hypothetical protein
MVDRGGFTRISLQGLTEISAKGSIQNAFLFDRRLYDSEAGNGHYSNSLRNFVGSTIICHRDDDNLHES